MKAIARAGLKRCTELDQERWASDSYRIPPYQYQRYLFTNSAGELRYASVEERQRLLGFRHQHVAYAYSASHIKLDPQGYSDKKYSLLGDTFAMVSFAWIVSNLCREWTSPMSPNRAPVGACPTRWPSSFFGGASMQETELYATSHYPALPPETLTAQLNVNHTGKATSLFPWVFLTRPKELPTPPFRLLLGGTGG